MINNSFLSRNKGFSVILAYFSSIVVFILAASSVIFLNGCRENFYDSHPYKELDKAEINYKSTESDTILSIILDPIDGEVVDQSNYYVGYSTSSDLFSDIDTAYFGRMYNFNNIVLVTYSDSLAKSVHFNMTYDSVDLQEHVFLFYDDIMLYSYVYREIKKQDRIDGYVYPIEGKSEYLRYSYNEEGILVDENGPVITAPVPCNMSYQVCRCLNYALAACWADPECADMCSLIPEWCIAAITISCWISGFDPPTD